MGTSASAAPKLLVLETAAGPVAPGAAITFFSSDLQLTSDRGIDFCSKNVLAGTVGVNGAKKDTINIEEASFTGEQGDEAHPTECRDIEPAGPAVWTSEDLPWPLTLSSKGSGKLTGSTKILMAEEHPFMSGEHCVWQASKIAETFAQTGAAREPLTLQITEQGMKRSQKTSNAACPASGKLNGTFTATSGGETVLAHT
jgi:hypothetical protein